VEPKALVHAYFRAVNAEAWSDLSELWHPGARLRAVGARTREGPSDIMTYYAGLFAPWDQHEDVVTRIISNDASLVAEVTFRGTTEDGIAVTFDAIDVFDVRDGLLFQLSSWYDLVAVRRQLGR
jgi:ketosteroid isomerase-like protein